MNIWDWLILAAVAAVVFLAARQLRSSRKSGRCSAGCDCCSRPCAKKEQKA